jgi:hypothetical protein
MKEITLFVIATLIVTIYLSNFSLSDKQLQAEVSNTQVDYFTKYGAEECTKTLEVECAIDIERTVVACSKAF